MKELDGPLVDVIVVEKHPTGRMTFMFWPYRLTSKEPAAASKKILRTESTKALPVVIGIIDLARGPRTHVSRNVVLCAFLQLRELVRI